jgi:hypothetical protein
MTKNANEVMAMTENIQSMLNELQEIADDHFQLRSISITDEQVEELLSIKKRIKFVLSRAKRVSQN